MSSRNLNRRGFLGAAGAAGLTVAGAGALTACSTGGGAAGGGGAEASAKLKLPTYVAAGVPAPDLPGNADGLDPGLRACATPRTWSAASPQRRVTESRSPF